MCQLVTLAPYTSLLIVISPLHSVLRVQKKAEITKLKKACTHQTKACIKEDVMLVSRDFC